MKGGKGQDEGLPGIHPSYEQPARVGPTTDGSRRSAGSKPQRGFRSLASNRAAVRHRSSVRPGGSRHNKHSLFGCVLISSSMEQLVVLSGSVTRRSQQAGRSGVA